MQHFNFGKPDKYITVILAVMVIFSALNCGESTDQNEIQNITSIYVNGTNSSLKIINYKNNQKFVRTILQSKSFTQKNKEGTDGIPDSIIYRSDSAKVIFGNQKVARFKKFDNSSFNFLDGKNHNISFPSEGSTEQKYTFTTADLNNAVPCNGNCD